MPKRESQHELRCFCARKPLLAVYGMSQGEVYLHIKVFKQDRIFGEIIAKSGNVQIRCRECLRWHRVVFRKRQKPILEEISDPIIEGSDDGVSDAGHTTPTHVR